MLTENGAKNESGGERGRALRLHVAHDTAECHRCRVGRRYPVNRH